MPSVTPRCRFAPSPTGYLHVGSARTALFNWLFARHVGGQFVLRIEDTDASRNQPELVTNILDSLRWLGLDWDEGPHFQSQRADRHREVIDQLLSSGAAYLDEGAVRLRVPAGRNVVFDDVIRGRVSFESDHIEDFVIRRSDGSPMFLLANVVDDLDMGITHVIRGEDMINNMPKQLLLSTAMGSEQAVTYAHLPLLVDEQRRKLSKRFGDVAIEGYRDRGFVAPAMANYLATLGWGSSDNIEIRPMTEIIERFDLADVNGSSAFFDVKKLTHFNGEYIKAMGAPEFLAAAGPFSAGFDLGRLPVDYRAEIQGRAKTLTDLPALVDWLFLGEIVMDPDAFAKALGNNPLAADVLDGTVRWFEGSQWRADALQAAFAGLCEELGIKPAKAQAPVRVALTGRAAGPPLYPGLELLGPEVSLARLRAARAKL
ncbi:MAG: glutamate--tRNA ligase [Acidimicrobiales bacterium]